MKEKNNALKESEEFAFDKIPELLKKEGMNGWKLVQNSMLKEKSRNPRLQDAIDYIMTKYQPDFFRPAFVSFCCKSVGGSRESTIPIGASLTLFGWAIGIHDDIIDQTRIKNKRFTVLGKFGKDMALILSDVLLFKGFTILRKALKSEISMERFSKILETMENIWFQQSAGEAFEIQTQRSIEVTPKDCLDKIRLRASEMEACARIGGIIGGGTQKQIDDLGKYGRLLGMMAILRNELVDMLEPDVLKHRIRRESLPLPIVYALQDQSIKLELANLITKTKLEENDLANISRLSNISNGIECVANLIEKMSKEATICAKELKDKNLEILGRAFPLKSDEWKPLLED